MNLSKHTIEVVADRIEQLDHSQFEYPEDYAEWESTKRELETLAASPTIETLSTLKLAQDEIDNIATNYDSDDQPSEAKAIEADLCRCGYHEKFDPNTVWSRRPRTRKVDGIKYVV